MDEAMMRNVLIAALALGLASCKGSSKVTSARQDQNTAERKKLACAQVHVDMNTPHIDWYEADKSILNSTGEILVLPKNYKIYGVDTTQLGSFFRAAQAGNTVITVLPLPSPAGCQLFIVNNPEERGKIPQGMIKAAGESNGQKATFNYYRENLTAHVNWFDIQYEMMTVKAKGLPYVIVYEKMPPPPDPNKNQQEAKPEIIEFKYNK